MGVCWGRLTRPGGAASRANDALPKPVDRGACFGRALDLQPAAALHSFASECLAQFVRAACAPGCRERFGYPRLPFGRR